MSTMDISLLLSGVNRRPVRDARALETPLRMVLVEGEAMRLPLSRVRVSVLSGTAWVTQAGRDMLLQEGAGFDLSDSADRAVISPVGAPPLFFEVL